MQCLPMFLDQHGYNQQINVIRFVTLASSRCIQILLHLLLVVIVPSAARAFPGWEWPVTL